MAPMSGWLIALLVILVIFIIVMIVLAIVSSGSTNPPTNPPNGPPNGPSTGGPNPLLVFGKGGKDAESSEGSGSDSSGSSSESGSGSGSESGSESGTDTYQTCRNIDILYANISLSTGEFIQNAKNSSKRVGNSFNNMNKHAVSIGQTIQDMHNKYGKEYSDCLLKKNQIYKNLVEHIIVKNKILNPNDQLLQNLNEINEKMGSLLVGMNKKLKLEEYVTVLHEYDVLVVKQIRHTNENNNDLADQANQKAQEKLIIVSHNSCR
jgi:hypothetical protein